MIVEGETIEERSKGGLKRKRVVRFRNYAPFDKSLLEGQEQVGLTRAGKKLLEDSEKLVRELEEKMQNVIAKVDSVKVAPKKVNWDLKRNVAKKMKKLARETQRAVLVLAEEERKRRLSEEEGSDDGSYDSSSSSSGSDAESSSASSDSE